MVGRGHPHPAGRHGCMLGCLNGKKKRKKKKYTTVAPVRGHPRLLASMQDYLATALALVHVYRCAYVILCSNAQCPGAFVQKGTWVLGQLPSQQAATKYMRTCSYVILRSLFSFSPTLCSQRCACSHSACSAKRNIAFSGSNCERLAISSSYRTLLRARPILIPKAGSHANHRVTAT